MPAGCGRLGIRIKLSRATGLERHSRILVCFFKLIKNNGFSIYSILERNWFGVWIFGDEKRSGTEEELDN
jgi:hypothetical protein